MPLEQRRKLLQGVFRAVPQKDFHFHAAKDLAMAETADYGFMLWDGLSKGTLSEHIKHILEDGELEEDSVVRLFRTTAAEFTCRN